MTCARCALFAAVFLLHRDGHQWQPHDDHARTEHVERMSSAIGHLQRNTGKRNDGQDIDKLPHVLVTRSPGAPGSF